MAKILVIDDNPELLQMIELILEKQGGHRVLLSAEGEEGLQKAISSSPDLAIVDVMMPGVSGYEICRQMRANPATADIPILILTARGQSIDRQAALDAGADEHLVKPVEGPELLEHVDRLLHENAEGKGPLMKGTVALFSPRGGVGVTTLAVNLALTLTQARPGTTCLVDLCPSSGHVALQLGLRPKPNWAGLLKNDAAAAEEVNQLLLKHRSELHVMASPIFPVAGRGLSRKAVLTMLQALQEDYQAIIVDTPSILSEATMATLDVASVVGLVITPEAPSIQSAVGTLRALKQRGSKLHVILNHTTPRAQAAPQAIEKALRRPLVQSIPFDPDQARALSRGNPLAIGDPGSALAQATLETALALARAGTAKASN